MFIKKIKQKIKEEILKEIKEEAIYRYEKELSREFEIKKNLIDVCNLKVDEIEKEISTLESTIKYTSGALGIEYIDKEKYQELIYKRKQLKEKIKELEGELNDC